MNEREQLLERMSAAIARMKADGAEEEQCPHYLRFLAKYEAVKQGASYTVKNVAPYMIAYVGTMIASIQQNFEGQYAVEYDETRSHLASEAIQQRFAPVNSEKKKMEQLTLF